MCVCVVCSGLLNYLVQYARQNGWICVLVHNTHEIINGGKVIVPSKRTPGLTDQHDMAVSILKSVRCCPCPLAAVIPWTEC